jgi:hypothetical protein
MAKSAKGRPPAVNQANSVRKVGVKAGPKTTNKVNPSGADQLGQALGVRRAVVPLIAGQGPAVEQGNAWAARQVGSRARPGGSCDQILRNGGNTQHGEAARGVADWGVDVKATRGPKGRPLG